jgi:hypothetical protein
LRHSDIIISYSLVQYRYRILAAKAAPCADSRSGTL